NGHTRTATDVLCVLTDTHGCPVQPTWAKITRTGHGKGQRAEDKDQRADMCTDGQPRTSYSPRGPKSPEQSTGRVSVLRPRTNVLICVLMDSHGRHVCADGHTQTHTNSHRRPVQPTWAKSTQTVHGKGQRAESKDQRADMCTDGQPQTSCVRTHTDTHMDTHTDSHGRPVCADGMPQTSCVCWQTPADIQCVLNRQPTWAKITRTVHGKGQRAEAKDQCADMCTDGQPQTSCVHTRTAIDVLCVLTDTHGCPVCADGHPRTSSTDVLCVLTDSHEQPRMSCVYWRTPTDVLCVLNRQPTQPTWAKFNQTVHGKGQRAESKDQRAAMCTDGQPRTSCVCRRTHTDTHGHTHGQPRTTNVLICVLMDSHGRPVCADGHRRTHTDSHRRLVCAGGHPQMSSTDVLCVLADTHGRPVCTEQTAYVGQNHPNRKGQRAESKDQRADMCTDGHPRTSCVC
ncbi:unnamed protein product, partial [Brassica rapa]